MTATAGRYSPFWTSIFDDFIQNLWSYIEVTRRMLSSNWSTFVAYPHRPMTLHSPTVYSLAVLNHKILRPIPGSEREIRRSPNVSFNKSIVARAV
ncbi:hypothetical protein TNCV_2798311 [Trichonephila clavipes]|nr:hypothetical protein TNCV_2798311 [Trichonephila clavipes]